MFYVYCLFRPDGRPCYVGKGSGRRYLNKASNRKGNAQLAAIFARAGGELPAVIIHDGLAEETALAYERALIGAIGRGTRGPLVNLTDGGEKGGDFRGRSHSEESKAKMRAAALGRTISPEQRQKMSDAHRGTLTAEHLAKMHAARTGRPLTPQHRENLRIAHLGHRHTPATIQRMSAAKIGKPKSEQTRTNMRTAWIARKERTATCA